MLDQALKDFFQKYPDISEQKKLAVAVSGGPDSMALAASLIDFESKANQSIELISVNHDLRKEAEDELKIVSRWAKEKGVPHVILKWEGQKPESAIMEEARQARYALMADYCEKHNIQTLFVGHHQNDQAETFLIRLSKGSGLDGLGAMQSCRPYNDQLVIARPFLAMGKEILIQYCNQQDVPFVHDSSNKNDDYLRPRLRASMDVLEQEGLTPKRLAMTSMRLSRARDALDQLTAKIYQEIFIEGDKALLVVSFSALKLYPEEIGLRVLQHMIETLRPKADYPVRMEKLEELFYSLWQNSNGFKPRTLGKCKISIKNDKGTHDQALLVEKE